MKRDFGFLIIFLIVLVIVLLLIADVPILDIPDFDLDFGIDGIGKGLSEIFEGISRAIRF